MAISSAMYAAVTGLSALSTGMQTISNNIANVNTVGFKAGRTNYEDLISQSYSSGGRTNQIGRGVKVASIQSMFTQGSFMSSAQDTDLAIAGEGFFSVRNSVTNEINYTRAGNFTINKDGYMEDPSGNIVQGWQMSIPKPGAEAVKIGTPTDIKITVLNAPPLATSQIKLAVNLDADDEPAYYYGEYELAESYAHQVAEPVAVSAQNAAALATWDADSDAVATYDPATRLVRPSTSSHGDLFNEYFVQLYNETYGTSFTAADISSMEVLTSTAMDPDRSLGQMTEYDFNYLVTAAESTCKAEAEAQGNSKVITTTDSMLLEVIEMKR